MLAWPVALALLVSCSSVVEGGGGGNAEAASSGETTASVGGDAGGGGTAAQPWSCGDTDLSSNCVCDPCLFERCCPEAEACMAEESRCSDFDGWLGRSTTPAGVAFAECMEGECAVECAPQEPERCDEVTICDTGLTTGGAILDACLSEACCSEFTACVEGGPEACDRCFLEGGGALCDDARACWDGSGCN